MDKVTKHLLLGVFVVLMLFSSLLFMEGGKSPSALVTGIATCSPSMTLTGDSYIKLYPGGTGNIAVTITEVKCGFTHAVLTITDIPEAWYTVEPSSFSSLAPADTANYVITLSIPEEAGLHTYVGTYKMTSNEGILFGGTLEMDLVEAPAKPAAKAEEPSGEMIEGSGEFTTKLVNYPSENTRFWWALGLGATVLGIVLIGSDYFKKKR